MNQEYSETGNFLIKNVLNNSKSFIITEILNENNNEEIDYLINLSKNFRIISNICKKNSISTKITNFYSFEDFLEEYIKFKILILIFKGLYLKKEIQKL